MKIFSGLSKRAAARSKTMAKSGKTASPPHEEKRESAAGSREHSPASPGANLRPAETISIAELTALVHNNLQALWSGDEATAKAIPPIMIWGAPGVGKSTAIRELAETLGIGFIDVRLAQREPVDMRGLPVPDGEQVRWLVSSEWPRNPKSRGIIVFDELTAADKTLQVAAYEFSLDRRLGELYQVPKNWYILAAGNRTEDRAVACSMSSALANRFLHVEIQPSVKDFLNYGRAKGMHPAVTDFIRSRPKLLFSQQNENLQRGWPTPRSWERVSTMMNVLPEDDDLLRHTVYGLIGNRAGVEFMAFHETAVRMDVKAMMLDPAQEVKIPVKADLRYALCAGVAYYLWRGRDEAESRALLDGFFRISLALTGDFAALLMMDAIKYGESCRGAAKIYKHPQFKAWEAKHGKTFRKAVG